MTHCKICNTNVKSISAHLHKQHQLSIKEYYDSYIKTENEGCCKICGNLTRFKGLKLGYAKTCSIRCNNILTHRERSPERKAEINKRISNTLRTPESKNKTIATNMKKYGIAYPNAFGSDKYKANINKKYGVNNVSELDNIRLAISETQSSKSSNEKTKINQKRKQSTQEFYDKFCRDNQMEAVATLIDLYGTAWKSANIVEIVKYKGRLFVHKNDIDTIAKYAESFYSKCSSIQNAILQFIKTNTTYKVRTNVRKIIAPLELDIYIPDLKLAFEINGNYYHQVNNFELDYHATKSQICLDMGIRLIHIFESDWLFNRSLVEQLIIKEINPIKLHKLSINECDAKEISNNVAKQFLMTYHIRYYNDFIDTASFIGLYYNNELVHVIQLVYKNNILLYNISCSKTGYYIDETEIINSILEECVVKILNYSIYDMPLLSSYIEILGYIDSQRLITGNKKYDKYVCVDSGRQIIVYKANIV